MKYHCETHFYRDGEKYFTITGNITENPHEVGFNQALKIILILGLGEHTFTDGMIDFFIKNLEELRHERTIKD